MKPSTLRGVIVGAGFFADFQAEAWQRMPDVEIVAVADPRIEHAHGLASKYGIQRTYADAEEMLRRESPDFADIVTRPDTHPALAQLAASHRIHVICQKPMAESWADCLKMTEQFRSAGVRLLIHENWRRQPWYREVRRLIDAGIFGRIFHLGFCLRNGDGRGAQPYTPQPYFRTMPRLLIYETLVHFLDTFRFLAGEIQSVFCQTRRINDVIAGEDYALIQLDFVSGACGLIDANRISGAVPPEVAFGVLTIEGELASLRMTPQGELFITEYGRQERAHPYDKPVIGYKGDSVFAAQRHYADCLRSGLPCETEAEEYLQTVGAMFACYESAATGQRISLA